MADLISPKYPGERVFRFISDPEHKENLSGRVQAACLTCRRKKIKCSGEFPCTTCVEKGLVCEGLSERKRPRRESMMSMTLGKPASAGGDRKRKFSSTEDFVPLHRPISQLREQGSLGSDRGVGGNRRASTGTLLLPEMSALFGESPSHDHAALPRTGARTPTTPFRVDIWEVGSTHDGSNETGVDLKRKCHLPSNDKPSSANLALSSVETSAIDWANMQDDLSWWQPGPPQDKTYLGLPRPNPHELKRGQSQSPSDLHSASDPRSHLTRMSQPRPPPQPQPPANTPNTLAVPDNTQTRRQAVQLSRPDTNTNCNDALCDLLSNQPAMFDDMARLLASRPPQEDLMPSTSHVTPWWDVNDEISAMLSQAGDVLSQPHPKNPDAAANTLITNPGPASMATDQLSRTINTPTRKPLAATFTSAAATAAPVNSPVAIGTPTSTISTAFPAQDAPVPAALPNTMPPDDSVDYAVRRDLVGNFYW